MSNMEGAEATVHINFTCVLEICGYSKDSGGDLLDQGIGMAEHLSLPNTSLLKATCKFLRDSDPPVSITDIEGYKIHEFHLWY